MEKTENQCEYDHTNQVFYPGSSQNYKNVNLLKEACKKLNDKGYKYDVYVTIEPEEQIDNLHYIGKFLMMRLWKDIRNHVWFFLPI